MAGKTTPVVFITANIGSIFEEPSVMLKIWSQEFLSTVARLDPKFVALHCQEVGGKNYEKSMEHVEDFVQLLINSSELRLFDKVRIYLDEDYSSAENFTALGNFYFIHESITDVLIYDFESRSFVEVSGREIYSKNIEHVATKEKSKFPLEYFPECKWSRKGFLRTRWSLNGTVFDLVNIHLFHDASNFVAIESFPSVYSDTRRRALAYTLDRFQTDEHGSVPLFLFGDFNFRTDTKGVVKRLSEGLNSSTVEGEVSIIQFKQEDKVVLSLGKKEFSHSDHQTLFTAKDGYWLREFDKELDAFSDQLFEFAISFPPSYPFEENSSGDRCYMKTRCPAWCDRVVLSHSAVALVKDSTGPGNTEYGLMGRSTCMGDHKPVYLKVEVKENTAKEKFSEANSAGALPKTGTKESSVVEITDLRDDSNRKAKAVAKAPNDPTAFFMRCSVADVEKLSCSLKASISGKKALNETSSDVESDASRFSSCRSRHRVGRANNPGGEKGPALTDDKKITAFLASEMKVPDELTNKAEIDDTGQKAKSEDQRNNEFDSKSGQELDRYGAVKRVNSASLVENKPRKEDWKNSRCNSDVSWTPCASVQHQDVTKIWKMNRPFNRGNSRIRLISSSNSLNASLPRLTSHHSSSDEEWFEEVTEGDDDVLKMNCDDDGTEVDGKETAEVVDSKVEMKEPTTNEEDPRSETEKKSDAKEPCETEKSKADEVEMTSNGKNHAGPTSETEASSSPTTAKKSCDKMATKSASRTKKKSKFPLRPMSAIFARDSKSGKTEKSPSKTFSIFKRLTEGRKESQNATICGKKPTDSTDRGSFENLIVDPSPDADAPKTDKTDEESNSAVPEGRDRSSNMNTQAALGDVRKGNSGIEKNLRKDAIERWETIELSDAKEVQKNARTGKDKIIKNEIRNNERGKEFKNGGGECCCTVM